MKKTILNSMRVIAVAAAAIVSGTALGRPHNGPPPRLAGPMHGPRIHHGALPPPTLPARPHHHHHHPAVPFWTGVGVGLVGSLLLPPPPQPAPAVVIQAAPARVWVPPVYGERPIYRAGIFVGMERYIITPGYWR